MNQRPGEMTRDQFLAAFGSVYEHSPWIAAAVFDSGLLPEHDFASGMHFWMSRAMRSAEQEAQLGLIRAHPDLAGRLARAGDLTPASTAEQRGAGLDQCSSDEFDRFTALNGIYKDRFGFPFIMAVKGRTRAQILEAFERRVENEPATEFRTALDEIDKIALLRLADLLP
jgi:2-oxo-4-hydroxy-4-carboxy-5-ureidoimidazoline decarboxylase